MSLSYGFYDSVNGDRKYYAREMSSLFDGIIEDGIFAGIKGSSASIPFEVLCTGGFNLTVDIGRAWFNHTWSYNDSKLPLTLDSAHPTLSRIDTVVLKIDTSDSVRRNFISIEKGTPAAEAVPVTLTDTDKIFYHPLAYITVRAGATTVASGEIDQSMIGNAVPYVTAPVQSFSIAEYEQQWYNQFFNYMNTWLTTYFQQTGYHPSSQVIFYVENTSIANRYLPEAGFSKSLYIIHDGTSYTQLDNRPIELHTLIIGSSGKVAEITSVDTAHSSGDLEVTVIGHGSIFGSSDFVVSFWGETGGSVTPGCDKTYQEIINAYDSGKHIRFRWTPVDVLNTQDFVWDHTVRTWAGDRMSIGVNRIRFGYQEIYLDTSVDPWVISSYHNLDCVISSGGVVQIYFMDE